MDISTGGYQLFTANWELYRLTKLKRFSTKTKAEALQKGSGVHLEMKAFATGERVSGDEIIKARISGTEMSKAMGLSEYLKKYLEENDIRIIHAEKKYKVPTFDGRHNLIGIYDAIAFDGIRNFMLEYKTAGRQRQTREFPIEWKCNTQAESIILGARSHGFPDITEGQAVFVQDGTPPKVIPVPFERTQYQLDYYLRSIGMVCDVIEFLQSKYGINEPWPHLIPSKWFSDISGKCNNGWCECQEICGTTMTDGYVPDGFEIEEPMDFSDEAIKKQFEAKEILVDEIAKLSLEEVTSEIKRWNEEDV